jgi:ABC-type transport system involved in multi-copper enzyme maturation permease subunit
LLVRPISKWTLYVVKLLATWTTTVLLVIGLTILTWLACYARGDVDLVDVAPRCVRSCAILSLAVIAYCSLFGLMSLLTRRILVAGVLYTAIIEGFLATLPLSLRMGTIIYYTRQIAYRSLDFAVTWRRGREDDIAATAWRLDTDADPALAEHPQLSTCIVVLLVASLACTLIAGWLCTRREFHVKTPEKE